MKKYYLLFLATFICLSAIRGQNSEKEKGLNVINIDALKAQTGFLASDWTEGRETGTRGEYLSADYIASMLQLYGAQPGGDFLLSSDRSSGITTRSRTYFPP